MALGAWRHADEPPPVDSMADHMSDPSRELWRLLTRWMRGTYGLDGEPAWEGEERGWVLRFRRAGRPLVTLSPEVDGGFGALVVIGPSLMAKVLEVELSTPTLEAIEDATAYADGRWIYLRPHDTDTVEDVCVLVAIKSRPPRRVVARAVPVG
jgi:hypothetical protein